MASTQILYIAGVMYLCPANKRAIKSFKKKILFYHRVGSMRQYFGKRNGSRKSAVA
jgi:hypothetical protein